MRTRFKNTNPTKQAYEQSIGNVAWEQFFLNILIFHIILIFSNFTNLIYIFGPALEATMQTHRPPIVVNSFLSQKMRKVQKPRQKQFLSFSSTYSIYFR